jgi:hypothetical protein
MSTNTIPTPMEKLELRKELVVNLKKTSGLSAQKAQVALVLDYSGSMSNLYSNGSVQELVERVLPVGLGFDDNGEVDIFIFHNNANKIDRPLTMSNFRGYVDKYLWDGSRNAPRFSMGGTSYAPIIKRIVEEYIGGTGKRGILSGLFGGNSSQSKTLQYPVYVIFITDGENNDKDATESAIIEASKYGIFFQFIGIGNELFSFLTKLDSMSGRVLDNANFFKTPNLAQVSDETLYEMMVKEFKSYPAQARAKGLIQ